MKKVKNQNVLTAHVITTSPAPGDEEVAQLAEPDASEAEEEQLSAE